MSGILRLESLTKGDTLKQGDKTPLKYRLFDSGGEKLSVAGKPAKVRLAHRDFLTIGYEKDGLTVAQDDTVTFTIDSIIPPRIYYVEIIVDDKFIFPSRPDESKFTVNKSSLGVETDIIQIIGKEEIARDVKVRVEDELVPFLEEIEQAEAQRQANEQIVKSKAEEAITKANQADNLSKSVQSQFNQVVIDGDSSVEAAQARVDASGHTNATLKERLDKEHNEVTAQLAQTREIVGINLAEFEKLPPENDDTGRFKRAFASIEEDRLTPTGGSVITPMVVINIPGKRYKISDTITINKQFVNIISSSRSVIEQSDNTKNIFEFPNIIKLNVFGITFIKGKHALYIENPNLDKSMFQIDKCEFQLQDDYSIFTWGSGYAASPDNHHMSAILKINDCRFVKPKKVLHNVCDEANFNDSWVSVESVNFEDDTAFFKNLYGTLRFDNMFGVPKFQGYNNMRWVDNYDSFYATFSRFGGEDGGIPVVYQMNERGERELTPNYRGGQVVIENSAVSSGVSSNPNAGVVVLVNSVPQQVRIVGNRDIIRPMFVNKGLNLKEYFEGATNGRFNFVIAPNSLKQAHRIPEELKPYIRNNQETDFPDYSFFGEESGVSGQGKKTFDIPRLTNSFVALLTISSGTGFYRVPQTYLLFYGTSYIDGEIVNYLQTKSLGSPNLENATAGHSPSNVISVHFGDGDTGNSTRPNTDGGKFTVAYDRPANSKVTIRPIHLDNIPFL